MYRSTLFCALALVAAPLAAAEPRGDELDRQARRLERDTRELREEVLVHFRDRPQYRDLERHVQEIENLAGRVHEVTDREARPRHVRETLEKIDEEMRQVDRSVEELGRDREIDRRTYDRLRDELSDIGRILYRMRKEL